MSATDRVIAGAAGATVAVLAGVAGAISYSHMAELARQHGEVGWRAHAFPVSVDGIEIVASLVLLAHRRAGTRAGWLPWAALVAGTAASVAANVAVGASDPVGRLCPRPVQRLEDRARRLRCTRPLTPSRYDRPTEGATMIPTLILLGLVLGRWWRLALVGAALGWPALLLATGVLDLGPGLLGAAALAVANTAVGVLVHQGVLHTYRWLSRHPPAEPTA